jgi:hypothetical protein
LNRRRKEVFIREKQLEQILESFYDLTEKEQIYSTVQTALSIGKIEQLVSISQNILNIKI